MVTISEFAVFGIAQFTFGLLLAVVFLSIFAHKLRGQVTDSARKIQALKKQSKTPGTIKEAPPKRDHYVALISNELQNTSAYFQSANDGQTMSISDGSQDSKIASIRHLFLTAELEAATGDTSWEIFANAYAPLIAEISMATSDADIFTRNKWADLTEAATRVLEDGSAESQQILGSLIQTITRDLGFDEIETPDINPQLIENSRQNQPTPH